MKLVYCLVILTLTACGSKTDPIEQTPTAQTAINSKWVGVKYILDLRAVCFHYPMTLKSMNLVCDGNYLNTNVVNNMPLNNVDIQGNDTEGKLVFGNLAYIGAANKLCKILTAKVYRYTVIGNNLVLCDNNYNHCKFFVKE